MVVPAQEHLQEPVEAETPLRFDFRSESECFNMQHSNQNNRADIMKKYLVYMELPKIRVGDYRKSSCVSGNIIRFHFLLRIASDEANTVLRLQPIKVYRAPVVNFAVIHRPFLDDDQAKGPIPKSPGARSPLIHYAKDDDGDEAAAPVGSADAQTEEIVEDFRSSGKMAPQSDDGKQPPAAADATKSAQQQPQPQQEVNEEEKQFEVESPSRQLLDPPPVSPSPLLSDDNLTGRTESSAPPQKTRRPKKYFVYCEIPKVLIGDYRNSSVICSEIIHAHFLMKIARDEEAGQPRLQPIRRYHRPKVNFAVIHRSLIVDDEAIGPIPRSRNVKSPMIKEDEDLAGSEQAGPKDEVLHATMGFCYGRLPRSKYELVSQWSLVPNASGALFPELVLSKAEA